MSRWEALEYGFKIGQILEQKQTVVHRRLIKDIVADINRVKSEQNKLKITVNGKVAAEYGLDMTAALLEELPDSSGLDDLLAQMGVEPIEKTNYLVISKNKGEFKIENTDKEDVSTIIEQMLPIFMQHIRFLNNYQMQYLRELRDALIQELLTGSIELPPENN